MKIKTKLNIIHEILSRIITRGQQFSNSKKN